MSQPVSVYIAINMTIAVSDWTRRLPLGAIDIPRLPVHTVSYRDARQLRK